MATATRMRGTRATDGPKPYRFSVRQYLAMLDAGVLAENDRVELLGGIVVEKMTKHTPHNYTIDQLADLLRALVAPDWLVREEKSVVLGRDWRPEPDIVVARAPKQRYRAADPAAADIALLVEVADSSYGTDRGVKWHGYAAARVPVYWVVDLSRRVVEVYTDPAGRGKTARYRNAAGFAPGDGVPVVVAGREAGRVAVNDLLP